MADDVIDPNDDPVPTRETPGAHVLMPSREAPVIEKPLTDRPGVLIEVIDTNKPENFTEGRGDHPETEDHSETADHSGE